MHPLKRYIAPHFKRKCISHPRDLFIFSLMEPVINVLLTYSKLVLNVWLKP